jgi:hypothetical protein
MNEADLQRIIQSREEESLTLEYKAADALGRQEAKKTEITKDVSAMANSAGGRLIYGIKESANPAHQHLPECLDPVNRNLFSREWLEQVINSIRPRIGGLIIEPVALSSVGTDDVVYVIHIPQGTTAHQASDFRYYRRYNFQVQPMYDHEVRDVMHRGQAPRIELEFSIEYRTIDQSDDCFIAIAAVNQGAVLARFVNGFVYIPLSLVHVRELTGSKLASIDGVDCLLVTLENTRSDVVGSPYIPILPKLTRRLGAISITCNFRNAPRPTVIRWSVYADNSGSQHGSVDIHDLRLSELLTEQ